MVLPLPPTRGWTNAQDVDRFYEQILTYSGIVVAIGPFLAWLVFVVVPSWL